MELREKLFRCKVCDDHGIIPKNEFTLKCRNLECDGMIFRTIVQGYKYLEFNKNGSKLYFPVEDDMKSLSCLHCHNDHAIHEESHLHCGLEVYGTETCLEASERHHRETTAILSALTPPGTSLYKKKPTTAEEFAAQLSSFRSLYSAQKLKWGLAMAQVEKENRELKEEIENLKNGQRMKELEKELEKLEKDYNDQKAFIQAFLSNTAGLADLKTEMDRTLEQEKIADRLIELEAERAKQNQEIAKWKARTAGLDEDVLKIVKARDEFKEQLAECESEKNMHMEHVKELQRNNNQLQRKLNESQKKLEAHYPNRSTDQNATLEMLREEILELKERNAHLEELLNN